MLKAYCILGTRAQKFMLVTRLFNFYNLDCKANPPVETGTIVVGVSALGTAIARGCHEYVSAYS